MVLSSTPSVCRFVARPRRNECQPCQLGRVLSSLNACPSIACSVSALPQTAQRVRAGTITRLTRLSRLTGFPFPAWKIGRFGCASFPMRSLCASRASANCLTIGTGALLRFVLGSLTVLFQTDRLTLNSLPSKSAQCSARISPLRRPVSAACKHDCSLRLCEK